MAPVEEHEAEWTPRFNPWVIALTVTLATFMEVLDTSIANVALPHIAGSLGASQEEATWVLTSYLVSSAVVLPDLGLALEPVRSQALLHDVRGLFTVSFDAVRLCAEPAAADRGAHPAGRRLGGGLAPSEQAILADTFSVEKRGQAFALYGMAVVCAPAIGPTLGGWITDNYNWHWIFFINIPIGLFSLFLTTTASLRIRRTSSRAGRRRIRSTSWASHWWPRAWAVSSSFSTRGQDEGLAGRPDDPAGGAAGDGAAGVVRLLGVAAPDPIVDLKLLKNRNFGTAVFLQLVLGMVLFGSTVLIPQYLQVLLGVHGGACGRGAVARAGLILIVMMVVAGRTLGKMDPRLMVALGYVAVAAGLYNLNAADA